MITKNFIIYIMFSQINLPDKMSILHFNVHRTPPYISVYPIAARCVKVSGCTHTYRRKFHML